MEMDDQDFKQVIETLKSLYKKLMHAYRLVSEPS